MGSLVAELAEKLSSATNNFDIDEGTIYVNTSADTVAIGGTSPDGKFSIHQSDSADIMNLYDGTDVAMSVLDGGNVLIGGITTAETIVSATPSVQLEGLGYADSSLSLFNNSNDANGSYLYFGKSRGTALSADTIVQDGDFVGGIEWVAADGADRAGRIAAIYGVVDGTPGANDLPGELVFYTTADGANSGTQRMVIKADGKVGIGTSSPGELLDVVVNGTSTVRIRNNNNSGYSQLVLGTGSSGSAFTAIRLERTGTDQGKLHITEPDGTGNTDALTIDHNGNVGIGESSPAFLLHVAGTLGIKTAQPTLTFDRGGAYAWTIRNGDGTGNFPLSTFNIVNNGGTPIMTFKDDGSVGIGTTAPSYGLTVSSNVNTWVGEHHNSATSGNVYGFRIRFSSDPDDNTSKAIEFATTAGDKFQVFSDGDVKNHDNSYGAISDERIKTDIVDANSQWDDVKAIRVRNFKKKDDVTQYGDKAWSQIGVVAQELEKVSPKLVKEYPPSEWEMENLGFGKKVGGKWVPKQVSGKDMTVKGVSYSILQMKAFKALQEAMIKIEILEAKVTALENA